MVRRASAGIAQLQQNKLGGHDGLSTRHAGHSPRVSRVIFPQQGQVEECVPKDGAHHFLGSPLM